MRITSPVITIKGDYIHSFHHPEKEDDSYSTELGKQNDLEKCNILMKKSVLNKKKIISHLKFHYFKHNRSKYKGKEYFWLALHILFL